MKDDKFAGIDQFSIWWVVGEPWLSRPQQVVDDLAGEFGASKYGASTFVPHVTVVPDFKLGESGLGSVEELVDKVGDLARQINPVEFNFSEIEAGDSFFQCVYAKASVNDEMMSAVKMARSVFRPELVDSGFLPHLSLLYGDYDWEIRLKVVRKASEMVDLPIVDRIGKILLWTSGVPAEEWEMVAEFGVGS